MNTSLLVTLLDTLSTADWQTLLSGGKLHIINDHALQVSMDDTAHIMIQGADFDVTTVAELKQQIIERADSLLADYYSTYPLSEKGFNRQVQALVKQHGCHAFVALAGRHSELSLFVDYGEVIDVSVFSPKHPYGVFMVLDEPLPKEKISSVFNQWLLSGEAYQQYLGMNVCRYQC